MPIVHEFLIKREIPSQNKRDRRHWRIDHKETKDVESILRYAMRGNKMDEAKVKKIVTLISYRRQRITDVANLHGGAKGWVDAIKRAGLIVDDSDKWAEIKYEQFTLKHSPTGKPCTIIRISDHA